MGQTHLADVAGVSLWTIQRIEKSGIASPESVKAICVSYGVKAGYVLKNKFELDYMQLTYANVFKFKINRMNIKASIIAFIIVFILAFIFTM
jgi:DNA-binding XRE family transcriptional regulator